MMKLLPYLILGFTVWAIASEPNELSERFGRVSVTDVFQSEPLEAGARNSNAKTLSVVSIKVASNGCTEAKHFDVDVKQTENVQYLSFYRNQPDRCQREVDGGVTLRLSTDRLLAHKAIAVRNPIFVSTGTTR